MEMLCLGVRCRTTSSRLLGPIGNQPVSLYALSPPASPHRASAPLHVTAGPRRAPIPASLSGAPSLLRAASSLVHAVPPSPRLQAAPHRALVRAMSTAAPRSLLLQNLANAGVIDESGIFSGVGMMTTTSSVRSSMRTSLVGTSTSSCGSS